MNNNTEKPPLTGKLNPWISLIVIILLSIGFLLIGNVIGLFAAGIFYDFSLSDLVNLTISENVNTATRRSLYIIQGTISLLTFIVGPIVYIKFIEQKSLNELFRASVITIMTLLITAFIVLSFMGVNSIIIEWNMNLDFPDFMENFAKTQEDQARKLTEALTNFTGSVDFIFAFIVIAIIPAIGEEYLFRGLLQNKLWQIFNNVHVGIWLAGFIFGLIHLQFYGIFPRMLLGVLFGYLYYWSGNLWIPIAAHFVNNGFTLIMMFLYNQGISNYNIEEETDIPITSVIFSFIIFIVLVYSFRRYMLKSREKS